MTGISFWEINRRKADFNKIYRQPDPRAYFRTLGRLNYVIPHLARPIFMQLIDARHRVKGGPITILDVGCSYGVNGMLLKREIQLDMLRERYEAPSFQDLAPEELLALDHHFLSAWPSRGDFRVIGLDTSWHAVQYAEKCGAIDVGIVADLEAEEIPAETAAALAEVDLVISTGCVGYVGSTTFEKLIACVGETDAPWVASFVLRMFDYQGIERVLSRRGLVTERFDGATFVQRRFRDDDEMEAALRVLEARRLNTAGKESEGLFHAELFVSRPPEEVAKQPIHRVLSISSGASRHGHWAR